MGDGPGDIQEKVPDHHKPGMEHGISAVQNDPHGTLKWLEDNDPNGHEWVRRKWDDYLDDAPFPETDAKADDLLHACLMLYVVRSVRQQQVSRGLVETTTLVDEGSVVMNPETGEPVEIREEAPQNLPANRLAREARSMLKDLGVWSDDQASRQGADVSWVDAARAVAVESDTGMTDADSLGDD